MKPAFLKDVQVSPKDMTRLGIVMSNWLRVFQHMEHLIEGDAERALKELKLMLVIEFNRTPQRPDVLHRIYRRMNSTRRLIEEKQLWQR